MIYLKYEIMDGNTACSKVCYNFVEACSIYPITPASTMAELMDVYSNSGMLNMFSDTVKVVEMQSEAGAIGTVHGMLQNGVLATTFTASQGLLLMIPNMYKIAGELLPCVINVAARTVATHALSIMGDHSDIYAALSTGFAIFVSSSVQQVMDLTAIPYLSTLTGRVPFINFFDGFRTSHEYNKVKLYDFSILKELVDQKAIDNFRKNSLDIDNPTTRGTNQGDGVYFQALESRNKYYEKLADVVNSYMEKLNERLNTSYKPFNYYGDINAEKVIVAMGSVCETIKEYIDLTNDKIGLIEVHLFRPFSAKYLLDVLPKAVTKIAVLDRARQFGSLGEALFMDIFHAIKDSSLNIEVVGGRYGLSGKDTNLNDIDAIYKYLDGNKLKPFTVGIIDDVTNLSLERTKKEFIDNSYSMLIYGYGSDGMVTTSKDILTIKGNEKKDNNFVQGYFEYDSKKSGGVTKCHLRFSENVIRSNYYVSSPDVVVCSKDTYLPKYDILKGIKENGIFILNTLKKKEELDKVLPEEVILTLKKKNINFYIINASRVAIDNNIPNKISMIMEMAIFKLTKLCDFEYAKSKIKDMIVKNFERKGMDVVNSNLKAIDDTFKYLEKIDVNSLSSSKKMEDVDQSIFSILEHNRCDILKVSDFLGREDGVFEAGLSKKEKRGISNITPSYDVNKCISCNMCSFVCPHAVIRPYLLTMEEYDNAPLVVKKSCKDVKINDNTYKFTICTSPMDCTGCSICQNVCPTKAITMQEMKEEEKERFDYLKNIKDKKVMDKFSVKGSQFVSPKFMYPGSCSGCGETAYLKLLTQLYGDNLIIANATGCSSIYGASIPSTPYTVPWVNSLFEDNAEFGYGIRISEDFMQKKVKKIMKENIDKVNENNKKLIEEYLNNNEKEVKEKVYENLDYNDFKEIEPLKKYIKDKTVFLVGGDGWAYDIGYGGIDHVLSTKENVNILVLDTEVYSNTGGQASKSTRSGAICKFASTGKETNRKDLAKMALCYPHVYVATISMGANYMQTIKAIKEAVEYDGPSIIIAYSPCIAHGIKSGMKDTVKEQKLVTDTGYFPLFRYNPKTAQFHIDSKADFSGYEEIFRRENRYSNIKSDKEYLLTKNKEFSKDCYDYYSFLDK